MYSGYLRVCMCMRVSRVCLCACVCASARVCVCEFCVVYTCMCVWVVCIVCVCPHTCVCISCVSACVPVYEGVCLSVCVCVSCVCLWVVRVCVCEPLKLRPSDFRDLGNREEAEWDPCWSLGSGLPALVGWMAGWPSGRASSPALGGAPSMQWANPPVPPRGAWVYSAVWAPLGEHVLPTALVPCSRCQLCLSESGELLESGSHTARFLSFPDAWE